ncbi:MAG: STAS domain-containing protein [Bacteroidota bacterium]
MTEIKRYQEDDQVIIQINGEIDASSSIELDEALRSSLDESSKVLVDCEGLSYISSAGLGVFMSYIQETKQKEIQFVLYGMPEKVKSVFGILGLDQLIKIEDSKDKAKEVVD